MLSENNFIIKCYYDFAWLKMWRPLLNSALLCVLQWIKRIPRGTLVYVCSGKTSKWHAISCKLLSWPFVIVSGEVHRIYRTNSTLIHRLCGNRPTPSKNHCSTTKEKRQRIKCAGQDKKKKKTSGKKVPWDIDWIWPRWVHARAASQREALNETRQVSGVKDEMRKEKECIV